MRRVSSALVAALALCIALPAAAQTIVYVSPTGAPGAAGSCDTPVDEVLAGTEDQNAGDWKALRRLKRGKLKQDALAYVASADEAELHELADAIEQRREVLTSKFEL